MAHKGNWCSYAELSEDDLTQAPGASCVIYSVPRGVQRVQFGRSVACLQYRVECHR